MHPLRDKTAIVGVGASPQGKIPGSTALSLAVEAFKRALDDSGLKKNQIDGLLTFPGTTRRKRATTSCASAKRSASIRATRVA
jgi:3-oxoacyl-[acyl-carrier-protein] synthase III